MWVYQHTESHSQKRRLLSSLWTVGYYDPQGKWITEGDYDSQRDAAERVAWLNGETTYRSTVAYDFTIKANARIAELEAQLAAALATIERAL
jgi:hypothetical protein